MIIIIMHECLRCEYKWTSRIEGRPKNCPSCKSPLWDKAKASVAKMQRSHRIVAKAKQDGVLVPQPCSICGSMEKIQAHHEDYDNPLDVTWYCAPHHRLRHLELGDSLTSSSAINLRSVDVGLRAELKREASLVGLGLEAYCIQILKSRRELMVQTSDSAQDEGGSQKKNRGSSAPPREGRDKAPAGYPQQAPKALVKKVAKRLAGEAEVDRMFPGSGLVMDHPYEITKAEAAALSQPSAFSVPAGRLDWHQLSPTVKIDIPDKYPWEGGNRDLDPNNPEDVRAWQERDRQMADTLSPTTSLTAICKHSIRITEDCPDCRREHRQKGEYLSEICATCNKARTLHYWDANNNRWLCLAPSLSGTPENLEPFRPSGKVVLGVDTSSKDEDPVTAVADREHTTERANCPDCQAAAAHAYSDATTPGFFYTECEKHRTGQVGGRFPAPGTYPVEFPPDFSGETANSDAMHYACQNPGPHLLRDKQGNTAWCGKIGRASCRERV